MQTAYYLTKDHPQLDKIKFIMHPGVREHIFGTGETTRSIAELIEKEYKTYFKNLNFDLMRNEKGEIDELFYCRHMQPELREQFSNKTQDEIDTLIKGSIVKRFPRSGECLEGTYDRVQEVKDFLKVS